MMIEGKPSVLIWVEKDVVWNGEFNEYYIASWGSESPPEEFRGMISQEYFPGLFPHYYVELRLG